MVFVVFCSCEAERKLMAAGCGIRGFEEENEFFDSREEFSSTSGSCPGSPGVGGAEDLGFGV